MLENELTGLLLYQIEESDNTQLGNHRRHRKELYKEGNKHTRSGYAQNSYSTNEL